MKSLDDFKSSMKHCAEKGFLFHDKQINILQSPLTIDYDRLMDGSSNIGIEAIGNILNIVNSVELELNFRLLKLSDYSFYEWDANFISIEDPTYVIKLESVLNKN